MKVTALIPDDLVSDIRKQAGGETLTDSLVKALSEWNSQQKLRSIREKIRKHPLSFSEGFTARRVRALNRSRHGAR